jgi:hypothetical protein
VKFAVVNLAVQYGNGVHPMEIILPSIMLSLALLALVILRDLAGLETPMDPSVAMCRDGFQVAGPKLRHQHLLQARAHSQNVKHNSTIRNGLQSMFRMTL